MSAVTVAVADRVATVTMDRPHRHNAWTGRMHAEYREAMAALDADPDVRCVVVTGAGRHVHASAPTARPSPATPRRGAYDPGLPAEPATPGYGVRPEWDHDFAWHFGLRVPVIARVNGVCAGVGLVLACYCDLRVAVGTAKLTTATPQLGLPAEYGLSWLLPRLIGATRAADLLLTGRIVTAADPVVAGCSTPSWAAWPSSTRRWAATPAASPPPCHPSPSRPPSASCGATCSRPTWAGRWSGRGRCSTS